MFIAAICLAFALRQEGHVGSRAQPDAPNCLSLITLLRRAEPCAPGAINMILLRRIGYMFNL
jgi:hypothetical protein